MLSILLLSQRGEGYEIANRIKQDGHIAKFWVADPEAATFYQAQHLGLQVDRHEPYIETSDFVVDCTSGVGGLAETLRKRGKSVLGGGICGLLASSPEYALSVAKLLNVVLAPPPEPGIKLLVCGWFLGTRWGTTYLAQEYTRLLDGERGPIVDSMGIVLQPSGTFLDSLTPMLAATSYKGFLGVRVELVQGEFYFNGFETSLSGPWLPAIAECMKQRLTLVLASVAQGSELLVRSSSYGICARVLAYNGDSNLRTSNQMDKHLWPHLEEGSLGYVSAGGDTIREARRRVNRTLNNATTIDHIYRSDIGCNTILEYSKEITYASEQVQHEGLLRDQCSEHGQQVQVDGEGGQGLSEGLGQGEEESISSSVCV